MGAAEEERRGSGGRGSGRARGFGGALLVFLLGLLLYVPSFGQPELDNEEGRRAIPAREMLASGDFVLPTIWGAPYLNKPPLLFWAIAGVGAVRGGVDEVATRLPSVAATVLTAVLVVAFATRLGRRRAGLAAGVAFLISPAVFEKGALGELEALLALLSFVSVASLWMARGGHRAWAALAGLALAGAILTKGPPALVFFVAGVVGIGRVDGWRVLRRPSTWLAAALGLGLAALWVAAILAGDAEAALDRWVHEVGRDGAGGVATYLGDRWAFATGVFLGFAPASFVLAAAGRGAQGVAPLERFVRAGAASALALFLVWAGTRARYAYPVLPWVCLWGGLVLDRTLTEGLPRERRRLRLAAVPLLVLGSAGVLAALVLAVRPLGELASLDAAGVALVLALAAAVGLGWRALRRGEARVWVHAALALALVRGLQVTQVVPARAEVHARGVEARALRALVPEGEALRVHVNGGYNVLFYLEREVLRTEAPIDEPPGSLLLVQAPRLAGDAALAAATREVGRTHVDTLGEVVVLRKVADPAPAE